MLRTITIKQRHVLSYAHRYKQVFEKTELKLKQKRDVADDARTANWSTFASFLIVKYGRVKGKKEVQGPEWGGGGRGGP